MDGRFLDLLIRNCVICTFFDSHLYNIFPVCAVRSILLKKHISVVFSFFCDYFEIVRPLIFISGWILSSIQRLFFLSERRFACL